MKHYCDYCGEKKEVVTTSYGTTHYHRFICQDCIKAVNDFSIAERGRAVLNTDGTFVED